MISEKIGVFITVFVLGGMAALPGAAASSPFSQAQFVPDISAILDFSYSYRSLSDSDFAGLHYPGLTSGNTICAERGFALNYFELALESVVDPYFDLFAAFHIRQGEFAIEEAYAKTRTFIRGFQLKAGKFLSSFGRLNGQHDHTWSFYDQPLVYHALFGEGNLNELGAQINWVVPAGIFLQFGLEVLKGENGTSFRNETFAISNSRHEKSGAPLLVAFAKSSFDSGNWVVLGGVSGAFGKTSGLMEDGFGISGESSVWGADLTVKYLIDSYRSLTLQAEYLSRRIDARRIDPAGNDVAGYRKNHGGFYAEAIWRFDKRFRAGIRLDHLARPDNLYADGKAAEKALSRISAMLEFNPTEFSRIRLQYNFDRSMTRGYEIKSFSELSLQLNLAIGAHGAHPF